MTGPAGGSVLPFNAMPLKPLWDYVYGILAAEMNVGIVNDAPTPGAGTNTTGRLQSVMTVGKSTFPNFNALPYVGVDPPSVIGEPFAAPRRDKIHMTFRITMVVGVQPNPEDTVLLEDAWNELLAILDDGVGGGVAPILRGDVTLGSNAVESIITRVEPGWDKSPAAGSGYMAWMELTLEALGIAQGSFRQ